MFVDSSFSYSVVIFKWKYHCLFCQRPLGQEMACSFYYHFHCCFFHLQMLKVTLMNHKKVMFFSFNSTLFLDVNNKGC